MKPELGKELMRMVLNIAQYDSPIISAMELRGWVSDHLDNLRPREVATTTSLIALTRGLKNGKFSQAELDTFRSIVHSIRVDTESVSEDEPEDPFSDLKPPY